MQQSGEKVRAARRFPALDGLRAVAAIMVVFFHFGGPHWTRLSGWSGVQIFFVLSGFLITTLALREEQMRSAENSRFGNALASLPAFGADALSWAASVPFNRGSDEENSALLVANRRAGIGSDTIGAQGRRPAGGQRRGGSRRQLCADRTDRQWRTGLFDEVRKHPCAEPAATGADRGNDNASASAA